MPKNILVDLNVILDVFLERDGFEASRKVIELGETDNHQLHVSAHIVTTLAYLLENAKVPRAEIVRHLDWLLRTFTIVPVNNELLSLALKSKIADYEDAVIECAAVRSGSKVIITRNNKDFKASIIPALVPEEYIKSSKN